MNQTDTSPLPPVTIAICTFARGEILIRTIHNLLPQSIPLNAEVLIIDQRYDHHPQIANELALLDQRSLIRWYRTPSDSLTGKRNLALRLASSELILFVDDDVVIPPGFVEKHLYHYSKASISGLTGQVFHAIDPNCPPLLEKPTKGSRAHFINVTASETKTIIGCNFSVRKSAALSVGGFDEQFMGSSQCEDFDFADRLTDAGHHLLYDPELWLIHLREPSGGTRGASSTTWPEWTRTANIFMYTFRHSHKHGNFLLLFYRALRTGPLRREIVIRPWKWPTAWYHCLKGICYGWRHRAFVRTR